MKAPAKSMGKAQAVILEAVRSTRSLQRTNLYKAFYLAHLKCMDELGHALTDWPIVKMPHGPGVHRYTEDLLPDLVKRSLVEEVRRDAGGGRTSELLRISDAEDVEAFIARFLSPAERKIVREVARALEVLPAGTASALAHECSRSWRKASVGDKLDVYVDLLEDAEVERVKKRTKRAAERLARILGAWAQRVCEAGSSPNSRRTSKTTRTCGETTRGAGFEITTSRQPSRRRPLALRPSSSATSP